jgi:hypothetical protein
MASSCRGCPNKGYLGRYIRRNFLGVRPTKHDCLLTSCSTCNRIARTYVGRQTHRMTSGPDADLDSLTIEIPPIRANPESVTERFSVPARPHRPYSGICLASRRHRAWHVVTSQASVTGNRSCDRIFCGPACQLGASYCCQPQRRPLRLLRCYRGPAGT